MRQRIASAFAVVTIISAAWLMSSYAQESSAVNSPGPETGRTHIIMAVPVAVKDEPLLFNDHSTDEREEQTETSASVTNIAMNTVVEGQASAEKKEAQTVVAVQPKAEPAPKPVTKPVSKTVTKPVSEPAVKAQPAPDTAKSSPQPAPAPDAGQEEKDPASRSGSGQTKIDKVISIANSLKGTPYVRGGSTPKGFDCSGFTSYVFRLGAGVSLPRTSSGQATVGKAVSKDELQIGDIVYFNTNGKSVSHVGIYVGNNSFIHASYTKGITVTSLSNSYYVPKYLGARRVL
ncbi:C40 family peptidase [Phosphitispora fastidiosa]|uniref:C40 family peptidase n=1 Tax=Phosphitispora fastidiosa TaxID=2837202 RepID=UPI001E310063|nr:C40 family peptidase [Phosphitispora fastidiosa]MBU7005898.1 cell wall-associated NlpC family hydrolase [Phosphitispora fastidiosa]